MYCVLSDFWPNLNPLLVHQISWVPRSNTGNGPSSSEQSRQRLLYSCSTQACHNWVYLQIHPKIMSEFHLRFWLRSNCDVMEKKQCSIFRNNVNWSLSHCQILFQLTFKQTMEIRREIQPPQYASCIFQTPYHSYGNLWAVKMSFERITCLQTVQTLIWSKNTSSGKIGERSEGRRGGLVGFGRSWILGEVGLTCNTYN